MRFAHETQACLSSINPAAVGYPGAFAAAANAAVITSGVSSTGVPMDRSIIPSGCFLATSPAAAIRSQGKSGNPFASGEIS
jgi:hypothetical protein